MRLLGDALLVYLGLVAAASALVTIVGVRALASEIRALSRIKDVATRRVYHPMSILVAAEGRPARTMATVHSLLDDLRPTDELVVVTSSTRILDVLMADLELTVVPTTHDEPLTTGRLRNVYRSARRPQLTVLSKEPGSDGRADALNAGINASRNALVCVVGAGCIPDAEALVRIARPLTEDPEVVGVGGSLRASGPRWRRWGSIGDLLAQAAWSRLDALAQVSADFACYRRTDLERAGGFVPAEPEAEAALVLQRHHHDKGIPARIVFAPDAVCRPDAATGRRWGLPVSVLWRNRGMLVQRGKLGTVAMPWAWLSGPLRRLAVSMGFVYLAASILLGRFDPGFAVIFAALVVAWPVLMVQLHAVVDAFVLPGPEPVRRRMASAA